jgi:uncharacterized membrane protein
VTHIITYEITNSILSNVNLLEEDFILNEIEGIITEFNLTITQKTTLSTMKGTVHYHLKRGKLPGILELTYWPQKKRLWIEIHDNRKSEWNQSIICSFAERIADRFSGYSINNSSK